MQVLSTPDAHRMSRSSLNAKAFPSSDKTNNTAVTKAVITVPMSGDSNSDAEVAVTAHVDGKSPTQRGGKPVCISTL